MSRENDFYTEVRADVRAAWNAIQHAKKTLQREWGARDYGNTLPDGTGENLGLTKVELGPALFDGIDALDAAITAVAANLARVL